MKLRVEYHMKTEAYKYRIVLITLLFCDTAPGVEKQTCIEVGECGNCLHLF